MATTFNAALTRPSSPADDVGTSTILEHLQALRRAVIISLAAWAVTTVIGFALWSRVLQLLVVRGGLHDVYYVTPSGAFVLGLKIAIFLGFVLASPVVIQQAWWFVSPGLRRSERRLILPLMVATLFFFAVGIAFALVMLPLFLKILGGFAPESLKFIPFVDEYVGFVLVLAIGFGIVFELPVVLYTLGRVGVISSRWLSRNRFYWIVGLGILSALGTPGADPLTPLLMFVPLYAMFEGTTLLLRLSKR